MTVPWNQWLAVRAAGFGRRRGFHHPHDAHPLPVHCAPRAEAVLTISK